MCRQYAGLLLTPNAMVQAGMDSRWWIAFNTVTLVVLLSNRRPDGSLKYHWAEAMVPTFFHDALALFGAFTVNHPARFPRHELKLDAPRHIHRSAMYRRLSKPYFVSVALLKIAFDVTATLWAMETYDITALQVAIPALGLLALVFVKHIAMQLSSPDTPP